MPRRRPRGRRPVKQSNTLRVVWPVYGHPSGRQRTTPRKQVLKHRLHLVPIGGRIVQQAVVQSNSKCTKELLPSRAFQVLPQPSENLRLL